MVRHWSGMGVTVLPWWRHQMEAFSALLAICAGNSPVPGESPAQRPVTRSFDVFFDLRLNTWLSKQSWGWWFETLSRPLWSHRNDSSTCLFFWDKFCITKLYGKFFKSLSFLPEASFGFGYCCLLRSVHMSVCVNPGTHFLWKERALATVYGDNSLNYDDML